MPRSLNPPSLRNFSLYSEPKRRAISTGAEHEVSFTKEYLASNDEDKLKVLEVDYLSLKKKTKEAIKKWTSGQGYGLGLGLNSNRNPIFCTNPKPKPNPNPNPQLKRRMPD
jgi:hypothetical protein